MRFRVLVLVLVAAVITASTTSVTREKSAKKKTSAAETVAVIYTCPMHPDVKSDEAGKCPQCGMALEKKKAKMSSACTMKDGAKCTAAKMSSACTMKDGAKCCTSGKKEASTKATKGCCGM